jgi:hypothetical protein
VAALANETVQVVGIDAASGVEMVTDPDVTRLPAASVTVGNASTTTTPLCNGAGSGVV